MICSDVQNSSVERIHFFNVGQRMNINTLELHSIIICTNVTFENRLGAYGVYILRNNETLLSWTLQQGTTLHPHSCENVSSLLWPQIYVQLLTNFGITPTNGQVFVYSDSAIVIKDLNSLHCFAIWQPIIFGCQALNCHINATFVKVARRYKVDRLAKMGLNSIFW